MSVKFSDKDEEMVHGKNEFPEEGDSGGDNKYKREASYSKVEDNENDIEISDITVEKHVKVTMIPDEIFDDMNEEVANKIAISPKIGVMEA